ncbi:hypothetical protein JRQ81_020095, partial [Phrynocephalus forsythii]
MNEQVYKPLMLRPTVLDPVTVFPMWLQGTALVPWSAIGAGSLVNNFVRMPVADQMDDYVKKKQDLLTKISQEDAIVQNVQRITDYAVYLSSFKLELRFKGQMMLNGEMPGMLWAGSVFFIFLTDAMTPPTGPKEPIQYRQPHKPESETKHCKWKCCLNQQALLACVTHNLKEKEELFDPGFAASIIEGPKNVTILAGSAAHFNCTVSPGWDVLIWLFNGNPRLTLLRDGITYAHPGYSQKNYSLDTMFTSELTISNVQMSNSGQIKCSIQGNNDDMYAFLTVQVNGSLTINTSNVTVRKNQTVEVTCEALGWAPAPQISWTGSNILINDSMYITYPSQGSNGLYNEESILTLTPMTNVTVTCLATIDALSKPQNASANITVITVIEPPP